MENPSSEDIRYERRVAGASINPAQQNPQVAPPLPIIELSTSFINAAQGIATSNSSLTRRDAEPCAIGNPCADGRYENMLPRPSGLLSQLVLLRSQANTLNQLPAAVAPPEHAVMDLHIAAMTIARRTAMLSLCAEGTVTWEAQ